MPTDDPTSITNQANRTRLDAARRAGVSFPPEQLDAVWAASMKNMRFRQWLHSPTTNYLVVKGAKETKDKAERAKDTVLPALIARHFQNLGAVVLDAIFVDREDAAASRFLLRALIAQLGSTYPSITGSVASKMDPRLSIPDFFCEVLRKFGAQMIVIVVHGISLQESDTGRAEIARMLVEFRRRHVDGNIRVLFTGPGAKPMGKLLDAAFKKLMIDLRA